MSSHDSWLLLGNKIFEFSGTFGFWALIFDSFPFTLSPLEKFLGNTEDLCRPDWIYWMGLRWSSWPLLITLSFTKSPPFACNLGLTVTPSEKAPLFLTGHLHQQGMWVLLFWHLAGFNSLYHIQCLNECNCTLGLWFGFDGFNFFDLWLVFFFTSCFLWFICLFF